MEIVHDKDNAVPVTVLTGFLGAGKTTLLNRILNGDHGLSIGVLVNDFGAINIDGELVAGVEENMISLTNGCVCCTLRDDLMDSIEALITRPEPIEYILLEASGVAEPQGISMTLIDSQFRDRIRLDSITCVVDADQLFARADEPPELTMLKVRQIGFSDMIILNKVDMAGPEQVNRVKDWVNNQMNRVRIVEASYCDVPLEILLAVGRFDPAKLAMSENGENHKHDHEHDEGHEHSSDAGQAFKTWSYQSERPFSLKALDEMVKKRLPGSVYRCKGIVYAEESPDRRFVLQVVGRRSDVQLLDGWNGSQPRTRIVAIGSPEGMDEDALNEEFDSCLI